MKYAKYAVPSLLWGAGVAAVLALSGCGGGDDDGRDKPVIDIKDPVVLPASAVKATPPAPQPLGIPLQTHFVVLPEPDLEKTLASETAMGTAQQIGTGRAVAATSTVAQTQSALQWTALPSGEKAAAINIQSIGAYGLRAGVLVERLPDGARLRIYSQEKPQAIMERSAAEVNALLAENRRADGTGASANTWWTPDVGAGDATLEVVLPAGMDAEALRISVPMVSHLYRSLSLPTEAELADAIRMDAMQAAASKAGNAASCNLDASCTSNYRTARDAVARMMFTRPDGSSHLCTGTLLNNNKDDFTPYFLTADHCISTQEVASTLVTTWFYRARSCNATVPALNSMVRSDGAMLLHASTTTDSALLELKQLPPAGVTFAGWDARAPGQVGDAVYGLHHPQGDLLKYSVGSVTGYSNCGSSGSNAPGCNTGGASNTAYYHVRFGQGTAEGGSSGSGLFRNDRLIATLRGGRGICLASTIYTYGRFDKVFNDHIWRWLAGHD
ncbi:trypsin-like peptidase domain-containing protein [Comamonas piscis]|uniref:Trypsin-like peptidase domain-containing protein n=1 Tax=Comamonas piscis TaxID=1562974 RepID=A0A7G5EE14_9BURK|nr:trypsin-like peptidase domain-containing protein [Comamonas piscis]QMV72239.1 trypsin-like peptidase domain-containing protein [Comamonas piscis]WSO35000.1 trypsin-like peptidase domain-containing protein [Comamonas piscis]